MVWPKVRLDQVARVVSGGTPKTSVPEYWDGDVEWFTPKDLASYDQITIGSSSRKISQRGLAESSAVLLPAGAVIMSSRAPIGYSAVLEGSAATNQGFKNIIPGERLHAKYLAWWIRAHASALQEMGTGATFKELSATRVKEIEISLPPLEEQRRIARVLDNAARSIRISELVESFLDDYVRSHFSHLISNEEVEWCSLGELCDIRSGGTLSRKDQSYWDGEISWFSPKDFKRRNLHDSLEKVTPKAIQESGLKVIDGEFVAIVVRGMILAHSTPVSVIRGPATINQDIKVLELRRVNISAGYLQLALEHQHSVLMSKVATSAHGTKRLPTQDLENIEVPLLSEFYMHQIDVTLDCLRRTESLVKQRTERLKQLYKSLSQRAFAGEL